MDMTGTIYEKKDTYHSLPMEFEKTMMLGKIEDERRKGQQRMRWLDGTLGVGDGQGGLACCSRWSCKGLDTLGQQQFMTKMIFIIQYQWSYIYFH